MKPNYAWAHRAALELGASDDQTATANLARAYLEQTTHFAQLLSIAEKLAKQIVAPVSGEGSNGIGEVGATLDRLQKLKEKAPNPFQETRT